MLRIASGTTDQYVNFQRQTGLSGFTVYRSRNGAAWAAMTTPTVTEGSAANAPGVYRLLLDEDMTIGAGNVTEHMVFYITASGMNPVFLEIELYDPAREGPIDGNGNVNANIKRVNDVVVAGTGSTLDPWGPP